MSRYSLFSLARHALSGHRRWQPVWRDAAPRDGYDIIIVGGGGHGLATAYYLAKNHGITNVAVIEKGWIGGGNAGRNTTICSNYLLPGNEPFYELLMKLREGLEQDLNYNAMVSQRGVLNLYHSDAQRDAFARRGNAPARCRCRTAGPSGGAPHGPLIELRSGPLSGAGRALSGAWRHRKARCRRVGLCMRAAPRIGAWISSRIAK